MYGFVLRSKGMIQDKDNAENWLYFDYVPGEYEIRSGKPDYTGKICVIGSKLKEDALKELFNRQEESVTGKKHRRNEENK